MSKREILLDNQQKGLSKVGKPMNHYYAIGEKRVQTKTEKGESSQIKSYLSNYIASFRSEALQVFGDWARENDLTITYVGVYK